MTVHTQPRPNSSSCTVNCISYPGSHNMKPMRTISKLLALMLLSVSLHASANPFKLLDAYKDLSAASVQPTTAILQVDNARSLNRALRRLDGLILDQIPGTNIYLVSVPSVPLSLPFGVDALEINSDVALPISLEIGLLDAPAGTAALWYAEQPAMQVVNGPEARQHASGQGIVVADIDARFDHEHPALASRLVNGYDFVEGNPTGGGALNQSSASYMFEGDSTALNQSSASYMFEDGTGLNQSSASYMFEDELFQSSASYMFEDTLLNQSSASYMFEDTVLDQSSASYMFEDTVLDQSSASYMFEDTILDQSSASYMFEGTSIKFLEGSVVRLLTPAGAGLNHGTFTAGVIAATAPDAQIMPLRAFNDEGQTDLFTLAKAIWYAVDNGADVINMSWGTDTDSDVIRSAIEHAASEGVILVASAGNMNSDFAFYPAAYEEVVAVAATDDLDHKASFSSYGEHVFVSAPGVNIISAYPRGTYGVKSGTSFSAPMVAGQAALMKSLRLNKIEKRLAASSVEIDDKNPGFENQIGEGRIDMLESLSHKLHDQKKDKKAKKSKQAKKDKKSKQDKKKKSKRNKKAKKQDKKSKTSGGRS